MSNTLSQKTKASEWNYWMLEDPTWTIQTPPPGGSICIFFPAGTIRFGSPSRCGHSASRNPSSRSTASSFQNALWTLTSWKSSFKLGNWSIIQTYSNHHPCHNWRAGESEQFFSDELRCHGQLMPCFMFFKKCSRPLTGTNQTAKMLLFMGSSPANPNMTKLRKQNAS